MTRPYFKTAASVIAMLDKNPNLTSVEIGRRLGLHPAYVRKAISRNGRTLLLRGKCGRKPIKLSA